MSPPSSHHREAQDTSDAVDIIAAGCRPGSEIVHDILESNKTCEDEVMAPFQDTHDAMTDEGPAAPEQDANEPQEENMELQDDTKEDKALQEHVTVETAPEVDTQTVPTTAPRKAPLRATRTKKQANATAIINIEDGEFSESGANKKQRPMKTAPPLSAIAAARIQLITEKMDSAVESLIADNTYALLKYRFLLICSQ